jgi:hypothetical protein
LGFFFKKKMSNATLFLGLTIGFAVLSFLVGYFGIKKAGKQRDFWITTFGISTAVAGGALAMLINPMQAAITN